ncbi:MAG TPA: GAF domain-containing sensor histidine kinase [Candidatus Limnocylindrales bacterium]
MPARIQVQRLATWLLLGAALTAAIGYAVLRGSLPSDGARVAFYGDAWSDRGIRIEPIDAPAPGLLAGDVIVAVAGRPMEAWMREVATGAIADPGGGRPMDYLLERDGTAAGVTVAWAAPAIGATLLAGWSVLLFSIATAAIAAYVYARRPHEPAASALMILASGAAGSSIPWFLGTTVSDVVLGPPFLLHILLTGPLYMLMWPAGLHLALVFPTRSTAVRRWRWLVAAVYGSGLGAYLAVMGLALAMSSSALDWVGRWPTVQLAIVAPTVLTTIVIVVIRYLRTTDPAARARVRLVTVSVVASAVVGLVLFQGPELLFGRAILPVEAVGLIALPLPLGFAAAILRDHLFEIDVVIRRTVVYGGMTLGVLAAYVATVYAVTRLAGQEPGFAGSLLATGVAALVALPLRDGLQRVVSRAIYGSRDEPWRAMRRLGARLEWAVDPERAFPAVAEIVADALRLPYVGVEVVDEVGRAEIVAEHGSAPATVEAVPLVHGGEAVGRLLMGVRSGEDGFQPAELALLRDLARQAGAAIHAQRLRDDLARSRERLVVAREEERRRLRRDLHDGLGPTLAAIGMRAEAAETLLDDGVSATRPQLEALRAEVATALADVRRLVDGLRPPALDELGLVGAIGQQAARLDAGTGDGTGLAAIQVESDPTTLPDLPAAVEVAAYRITVEAMTNVVRHAGARLCRVRLVAGAQLTIEVTDDGRGLPVPVRAGTGLESMRERAEELGGHVVFERIPDGGTRVVARLPLERGVPA